MALTVCRVWIHGLTGRMGTLIAQQVRENPGLNLVGGSGRQIYNDNGEYKGALDQNVLTNKLTDVDLVIDFSTGAANSILLEAVGALSGQKPGVLVGTTGLTGEALATWRDVENLRLLIAPNTSVGVLILAQLTKKLAKFLPDLDFDLEIVETHHRHKIDAPSGTAKFLAKAATEGNASLKVENPRVDKRQPGSIGMHAIRGGGIFGDHEVRFISSQEEINLSHRALSRELFAVGAVRMGRWLIEQKVGSYSVFDVKL